MSNIKPIRTKTDYKTALKRIDEIISTKPKEGTVLYDELDVVGTLVSAYEDTHYVIDAPDPVEAVKYIMEEQGLKPKDLVPYFGSKGIVSEFLNHKRGLSTSIMKALHDKFGIPYEVLFSKTI
jgi:HTH-type transcriptional regulator/antitoxin HigA